MMMEIEKQNVYPPKTEEKMRHLNNNRKHIFPPAKEIIKTHKKWQPNTGIGHIGTQNMHTFSSMTEVKLRQSGLIEPPILSMKHPYLQYTKSSNLLGKHVGMTKTKVWDNWHVSLVGTPRYVLINHQKRANEWAMRQQTLLGKFFESSASLYVFFFQFLSNCGFSSSYHVCKICEDTI